MFLSKSFKIPYSLILLNQQLKYDLTLEDVYYMECRLLELNLGHQDDLTEPLNSVSKQTEANKSVPVGRPLQVGSMLPQGQG